MHELAANLLAYTMMAAGVVMFSTGVVVMFRRNLKKLVDVFRRNKIDYLESSPPCSSVATDERIADVYKAFNVPENMLRGPDKVDDAFLALTGGSGAANLTDAYREDYYRRRKEATDYYERACLAESLVDTLLIALKPMTDKVFYDNGDVSVDMSQITFNERLAAYFACKSASKPAHWQTESPEMPNSTIDRALRLADRIEPVEAPFPYERNSADAARVIRLLAASLMSVISTGKYKTSALARANARRSSLEDSIKEIDDSLDNYPVECYALVKDVRTKLQETLAKSVNMEVPTA